MIPRKIFIKKNKSYKYISISFIIFLFVFFFYFFYHKDPYFVIKPQTNEFYYFLDFEGGKEIPNLGKKGLHLSYEENTLIKKINLEFKYSIQLMTSNVYSKILDERDKLIKNKNLIISLDDLYIFMTKSILGIEYILLYKNFETREMSLDYCKKYYDFLKKCLIVNTKELY